MRLPISAEFVEKYNQPGPRYTSYPTVPAWEQDFWTPKGLSNDDFRGYMIFKEFDFHYQLDSPGSRERLHR